MKAPAIPVQPVLLTMAQLRVLLGGKSRNWVYDQLRRDPSFPRPRKLNAFTNVWLTAEVMAYIGSLPMSELSGLAAPEWRAEATKKSREPK